MEVHVPHDVLLNILSRVPAESVGRFKCVSKEWHSLLSSKIFKNMHIDHHQNNNKLLVFSKIESSLVFSTIDCEAPPSDKRLTPTRRPLPPFQDTTSHDIHILSSCHGLVCLGIIKDECDFRYSYSELFLWNPLTNEYKRLSKSNSDNECNNMRHSYFGLYYSSCEDDYKLLYLSDYYVYIYSLKSDSWRKVDATESRRILYRGRWSRGTYLNENLYVLLQQDLSRGLSSIIRFDTKTEGLSKIEIPNVDDIRSSNYFAAMMVKSDCIHVCVKYNRDERTTCLKLWKLDEHENMKEVVTYQLNPHVYGISSIRYLVPFHLTKNGNWLFRNCSSHGHKIFEADLRKTKHYLKGKGEEKGIIYDDFKYAEVRADNTNNKNIVDEEVRYVETFVSPNRYMK